MLFIKLTGKHVCPCKVMTSSTSQSALHHEIICHIAMHEVAFIFVTFFSQLHDLFPQTNEGIVKRLLAR